jgi:hypothetical protein
MHLLAYELRLGLWCLAPLSTIVQSESLPGGETLCGTCASPCASPGNTNTTNNNTSNTNDGKLEVPVPCHISEYVVCVTGIDLTSFKNFLLDFGTLPKMWYYFVFSFFIEL